MVHGLPKHEPSHALAVGYFEGPSTNVPTVMDILVSRHCRRAFFGECRCPDAAHVDVTGWLHRFSDKPPMSIVALVVLPVVRVVNGQHAAVLEKLPPVFVRR